MTKIKKFLCKKLKLVFCEYVLRIYNSKKY